MFVASFFALRGIDPEDVLGKGLLRKRFFEATCELELERLSKGGGLLGL